MRTPRVKLVPPRLPASHVRRPALERLLAEAERRRITSIVAGPGFGKSTLAASLAAERGWAWYLVDAGDSSSPVAFARGLSDALEVSAPEGGGPEDLAAAIAGELDRHLRENSVLVVDDVHELGADSGAEVVLESLVRQAPPELHFVLCSREEPPFAVTRLRGQGQVLDIDVSMLAFSNAEVEGVVGDPALGGAIYDLTSGWPAAVQLTAEMLQAVPEDERVGAVSDLRGRGSRLVAYLAQEVLADESPQVRDLLSVAAQFDRFSFELCEAVGVAPPSDLLAGLRQRGLIAARAGPGGWLGIHALLREFIREELPLPEARLRKVHLSAAKWFESQGLLREALVSLETGGDPHPLLRFFSDHFRELIDGGYADAVIDAARIVPEELISEELRHLIGRCYALLGRLGEALVWLEALPEGPERSFQIADILMQRGEARPAFDALVDATFSAEETDWSLTYNLIYIAFLGPSLGELDVGEDAAPRALALAEASGDLGHQADAHTAVADIAQARGRFDEAERHYLAARELAERAGNLLALCAAQGKSARFWTVQGRYREAIDLIESVIETADRIGFQVMRSEGRHTRAWLYARQGRFDEAAADLAAVEALELPGGARDAWQRVALGDLYGERGDVARARLAYQEGLKRAHPANVRLRSIALAGLARMVAADDPDRAAGLAAEAVELGVNEQARIMTTAAWVAIRRGELDEAREFATSAVESADERSARPELADALQALAFCSEPPDRSKLEEALTLWRELEEPVAVARAELALARLSGAKLEAERLEGELRALGVRDATGRAAGVLMAAGPHTAAGLVVQTLGGFGVVREGVPVPADAWQSKKSRDLLKILAARRGRPVMREELIEALWPEEDPGRTGNRLSVALSTLRAVLDPGRRHATDHFVASADGAMRLSLDAIELDVESFLTTAAAAFRSNTKDESLPLLQLAEAAYAGDFLEEDQYEDWAIPLRDEAQAVYIDVLRALATTTGAPKYFLRILERDRYDERAHLGLVGALIEDGAHGEARRAYRSYVSAMNEIGAEPVAYPEAREQVES